MSKILIVDDNEQYHYLLQLLLESYDHMAASLISQVRTTSVGGSW